MNKIEAIKKVNLRIGTYLLNNRNTHFANVNSAKNVWWFDIPTSKAFSQDIDRLHLLIYQPMDEELIHLKVSTRFFIKNRSHFIIRKEKGTISLELSCAKDNFLKDIRPGSGKMNFSDFIQ